MKKKIALVLLSICTSTLAFSQVSWNVKAGVNLNDMTKVHESKMKFGFHAGAGMDYAVTDMFSVQPSLMFVTKGLKIDEKEGKMTANPMYLQVPILAAFKFEIGQNSKFFVNAGPYLAYGLGGKAKTEITGEGEMKVNLFSKTKIAGEEIEAQMKRFDFGLNLGVGIELDKFIIGVTAEYGLANTAKKGSDLEYFGKDDKTISPKNLGIGLSVGYKF